MKKMFKNYLIYTSKIMLISEHRRSFYQQYTNHHYHVMNKKSLTKLTTKEIQSVSLGYQEPSVFVIFLMLKTLFIKYHYNMQTYGVIRVLTIAFTICKPIE